MQIIYKNIAIDVKKGTTIKEFFEEEIEKSENPIIACKFNNELKRP